MSASSRIHTAKSIAARLLVTLTLRQGRWTSRKTNRLAVPLRLLEVVALKLTRPGRDRRANLADQLDRALVEADHRPFGIGRFGIEIEHILHPGDVFGVDLRDAPHILAPGLQVVFG